MRSMRKRRNFSAVTSRSVLLNRPNLIPMQGLSRQKSGDLQAKLSINKLSINNCAESTFRVCLPIVPAPLPRARSLYTHTVLTLL